MKGPNCCGCIKTQFHFDIEFRRGTGLSHNPENLPDGPLGRNRCVCFLGQSSRVLLYLLWPLSVLTREAQVTGLGASGHPLLALGSWWPHAGSGPGSLLHSGGALQGPFGFGFAVLPGLSSRNASVSGPSGGPPACFLSSLPFILQAPLLSAAAAAGEVRRPFLGRP